MAVDRKPTLTYCAGLDLGRMWEYTALAVVERAEPAAGRGDPAQMLFAVRHLERFAPGTPYADVFARVAELFATKPLAGTPLVVDYTAVGRSVAEALRRSKINAGVKLAAVTAGLSARKEEQGGWLVPRTELVGTMQLLLQSGRLKLVDALPEAATLLRELESFRADPPTRVEEADLAAWRERPHDDLVLATALAAWEAGRHVAAYGRVTPMVFDFDRGWHRVGAWPRPSWWGTGGVR